MRLYDYLSDKGFVFYKTCRDKFNPRYTVWLYTWSEELDAAVHQYYNEMDDRIKNEK